MHTHPHSMSPSIAAFNFCFKHYYLKSLIICHNETVYEYVSNQMMTLRKISRDCKINLMEVLP